VWHFIEKEITKNRKKKLSLSWGKYSYKLWFDCGEFKKYLKNNNNLSFERDFLNGFK
jgi:hypothetical protein